MCFWGSCVKSCSSTAWQFRHNFFNAELGLIFTCVGEIRPGNFNKASRSSKILHDLELQRGVCFRRPTTNRSSGFRVHPVSCWRLRHAIFCAGHKPQTRSDSGVCIDLMCTDCSVQINHTEKTEIVKDLMALKHFGVFLICFARHFAVLNLSLSALVPLSLPSFCCSQSNCSCIL